MVVDSSVLVAAAADSGTIGRWAEEILSHGAIATPEIALAEATDIFRRLERTGRLTAAEASAAQRSLLELDLEVFPFAPFGARVWELRENVTAYDGWYVALAEALGAPLATLDERLCRAPGPSCEFRTP